MLEAGCFELSCCRLTVELEKKASNVAGAPGEEKRLMVPKELLLMLTGNYYWRGERELSADWLLRERVVGC